MKKILVFAFILILLIAGVAFKVITSTSNNSAEAVVETAKPVEVTTVTLGEIRSVLQLSGTIEPNSQVRVYPKTTGEIIEMRFDEGDRVSKGDILAVVEHETLELKRRQAQAAYQAAETTLDQAKKLAEVRVRSQIAQAQAQLESAKAALQQVEDLAEVRILSQIESVQATLASLQANLEKIKSGAREEDRRRTQATVDQAKASLVNAESNYKRMKNLFGQGAISKQNFERAQTEMDVVQAQYDIAVQQMQLIKNGARSEDVEAVEAQVRGAESTLKLAHAQVETKTWEKDVALAKTRVENAKATLDAAKALEAAKSWEAEITTAETAAAQAQAALRLAEKHLNDATIIAPIAGVISKRYLDLGGMASTNTPLFEIVDMETVKATVSVIESELRKIKRSDNVSVQVDALTSNVVGEITFISPTLDVASRAVTVEITIDNANMELKPGMFTKVVVPIETHESAVLISRSAVIEDREKNRKVVFVVESGRSIRRPVEFGLSQGTVVQIVRGLSEGERVVLAGQHSLKDGDAVTVVNP